MPNIEHALQGVRKKVSNF